MKMKFFLAVCCGAWLAGGVTLAAGETDPFADPGSSDKSEPVDAEVAALEAMVAKLGPRGGNIGVGRDDDGLTLLKFYVEDQPDLSVLRGLSVRKMQIWGSMPLLAEGKIMDLAPLDGMPLESLVIWKVPVKDLSPLKHSRLKSLQIMGAPVTDVSPLKDLPLTDLDLWSTNVSDISPLKGMRLKFLNIDCNESVRVTDLTPLEGMELETLKFHANGVTKGIEIVRGMKSLKKIEGESPDEFWKQYDADAPLREMVGKAGLRFTRLYGGNGEIGLWFYGDDMVDLSPLRGLPVVYLDFLNSKVSDLRPLADLPLRHLCVSSSALTDLAPLRGTPIKSLYLYSDNLVDLGPLKEMKLKSLSLGCPKVTDLSAIRHLRLEDLDLRRCGVTDLTSLEGISVEVMDFDIERISKGLEVLRGIKVLKQINGSNAADFWNERDGKKDSSNADPFEAPESGQSK